jgi:hypothetical protein
MSQADVKYEWIAQVDRDIGHATAHYRRTNRARLQILEERFIKHQW